MKKLTYVTGVEITEEYWQELLAGENNEFAIEPNENGYPVLVKRIITQEQILNDLRERRMFECYPVINRGQLWYETLTPEQTEELKTWYKAWLDVTETLIVPDKPEWL